MFKKKESLSNCAVCDDDHLRLYLVMIECGIML